MLFEVTQVPRNLAPEHWFRLRKDDAMENMIQRWVLTLVIICGGTLVGILPGCSFDSSGLFKDGTGGAGGAAGCEANCSTGGNTTSSGGSSGTTSGSGGTTGGSGGSSGTGGQGGGCTVCPTLCGNGVVDPDEVCDSTNFAGATCVSEKGDGWTGSLSCNLDCTVIDDSACQPPCGNNAVEGAEVCDGTALNGKTCETVPGGGYTGGALACQADCTGYKVTGCSPLPPLCNAGDSGTVDFANGYAVTDFGYLLHYAVDPEFYSTTSPTNKSFIGLKLPGQLILAGKNGILFTLKNGGAAVPQTWYKVTLNTLPSPICDGDSVKSQACLDQIAKSFRCQTAPYNEGGPCPSPVTFTAQSAVAAYNDATAGWQVLLVDLACP